MNLFSYMRKRKTTFKMLGNWVSALPSKAGLNISNASYQVIITPSLEILGCDFSSLNTTSNGQDFTSLTLCC